MHLRVAACAFPVAPVASPAAWVERVRAQVRFAADGGARLVVLPEYLTMPLLGLDRHWSAWTELWRATARDCARDWSLAVLAGSHVVEEGGRLCNRAVLALADGTLLDQDKLHPTPWERGWGLAPNRLLRLAEVDGVRIATLICYDVEFPACARAVAREGAEVLLVPSWTDDRAGFHRVRYCAHARAVENAAYVVHAPLVGGIDVPGFEQACGAAGVLTPCDIGFARDGLAVDGGWNQAGVVLADLDLTRLRTARVRGTVTPLADARPEGDYLIG